MKTLLTGLCCFFLTLPAQAEENLLIGTWQSDHKKTMDFMRDNNAEMSDKQYELSSRIFGKVKITFTKDQFCSWMPDWQLNGRPMKGWENDEWEKHTLIYADEETAITSGYNKLKEKMDFSRYVFEGPDTMWVYMGYGKYPLHIREYFKRIPTPAVVPCRTPDSKTQ